MESLKCNSNELIARHKLFKEMPASNYADIKKWALELELQAKRCKWEDYNWQEAARDALIYQCPDSIWRAKIFRDKADFNKAVAWGVENVVVKKIGERLDEGQTKTMKGDSKMMEQDEDRVTDNRPSDQRGQGNQRGRGGRGRGTGGRGGGRNTTEECCPFCGLEHIFGTQHCPAFGSKCYECGGMNHWKHRPRCKGSQSTGRQSGGRRETTFRGKGTTTTIKMKDKDGKSITQRVNFVDEETPEEEEPHWEYDSGRVITEEDPTIVTVSRFTGKEDHIKVGVTLELGQFRIQVPWVPDSGVKKSMLSEHHLKWILKKNPEALLKENSIRFRPYSTDKTVPVMGYLDVKLKNQEGGTHRTKIYAVKGEKESLLGKDDAIALGILKLEPRGEAVCSEEDRIRCLTQEELKPLIKKGIVSDDKTQAQIDQDMEQIVAEHQEIFQGMGRAKVDPIHIHMDPTAVPVTQGKRPIPVQFKEKAAKKLQEMLDNDLIEGPLPPEEIKGWVHNMVITKKGWSEDQVRINIDTKMMNDYVIKTKIPILTTEQLRHTLEGSDKFSTLDARDAFYHFLLTEDSQELFKFHGVDGVYRFKVLVMGTPPASGECHKAMSRILYGLEGVAVIKDDILVHGKGKTHDENLRRCLKRLGEYRIKLRKEKCKLGQQAVIWFGHVYSKQGMSADPDKVRHIKAWPRPADKAEVKSFLQTVQFVAQFMRGKDGRPHSDITAPLREQTQKHKIFKWTRQCEDSFQELKKRLTDKSVLVPYMPHLETRLYVDHGPDGIASTIAQNHEEDGKDKWKAVHYKSRRLDKSEKNYWKIEGESLGIYAGIIMNKDYLYGTEFTVMTDHEALPTLYNNPTKTAPDRVNRHRSRLGAFDFKVKYVPGDQNISDYGSRHPDPIPPNLTREQREDLGIETEEEDKEVWINHVIDTNLPAITLQQVREATAQDEELNKIV